MSNKPITGGTVLKLLIYSFVVGFIMYSLEWSPGDILGWIADTIAEIWSWFSGSGLEYVLLGATIVVPLFLFSRLRERMRSKNQRSE
ncbi:MAG: hypothetical protein JJ850_05605 [Kordiimonadaceae bacterium]|nr:hypothetical protein [Kordiimonadaceae bacterium]MBO6568201.1 hypothetical protein [Kordiimonadaceae bacterium]MBO6964069.1 hypothetical protein [Kordiimonadaceae bacterium]